MSPFVQVVQPSGILTGHQAKQLRYHIDDLVNNGVNIVLIDLQNVTFMDSSGLGALIAAQRIVKTANCQLFLCSIADQVKMLFEMNKLSRLFEIFADKEEFQNTFFAEKLTVETN